jgi:small subunit ribosomal protein S1
MTESFAELFEESLKDLDVTRGSVITGTVVSIDNDWVTVNAGLKSEGIIPRNEFVNEEGELEIAEGDEVEVAVDAIDDGMGYTRLSREKAKRAEVWGELEKAFENEEVVTGQLSGKVKGGFTVDIGPIRAFLPGSLVDIRPVRDVAHLEGKDLDFKVIKLDAKRNNVVVSRRAVMEAEHSAEREALLESLQEGQVITGIVKNLTDYGAFVDLGGIDGLLHITDMAWKRIKHPSEIVEVGQEIEVKVLKFDRDKMRVSLGLKQLGEDPWHDIVQRYPENARVKAKVTNLTDYGCFAEIEEGVEGLVHVSEMDWTNKNIHPSKVVEIGDEVEVMILDIDQERRRISLGIKQCQPNPWEAFEEKYQKGDRVTGKIKSITDFGIFIGLEGGIDGLVHLSDISWEQSGEEAVRDFSKGDEIETVILSIDAERERISLGIKQLTDDPFAQYVASNDRGTAVQGTVKAVEPGSVTVELADEVEAELKAGEISDERVEDATTVFQEGDKVDARIASIDRKNRTIQLTRRSKTSSGEEGGGEDEESPRTIGDLIKQQMESSGEE